MRLNKKVINLKVDEDIKIDYNYNFGIMRNIYKTMDEVDKVKTKAIHDKGYNVDGKVYKLFNFQLFFENATYVTDGIEVKKGDVIKLILGGAEEVLNLIFKGILKNGGFNISGKKFSIKNVEDDKKIKFNKIMLYKVRSPIVESIFNGETKKAEFLNPYDERYYTALGKNLLRKYKAIYGEEYEGELFFEIENFLKVKQKFIKDLNTDSFIVGFTDFEIYIEADLKMQKVAYTLGLGQNNSLGMGNITYICGRGE